MIAKLRRDPAMQDEQRLGMDFAFLAMLFLTSLTGLLLLVLRATPAMPLLLALHLGVVFALFITMPYGKFVHGIYRFAALVRYAKEHRAFAAKRDSRFSTASRPRWSMRSPAARLIGMHARPHRHSLHLHARRHLARALLPRRGPAGRHGDARPRAARRDGLARPAPDRRARRRRHADQQGRDRVEVDAAGRRRRLPVRAGRYRQADRRHQPVLRQHAGRRRAVRARDRDDFGAGRRDARDDLQRQHRGAHRGDRPDPRRPGQLHRRRAHRRRAGHRGADRAQLHGRGRLGRGQDAADRKRARHDRRHRRDLHRRRDADDPAARKGFGADRLRGPRRDQSRTRRCSRASNRSGSRPGAAWVSATAPTR